MPLDEEMDEKYGPQGTRYDLRPRHDPWDYCHIHTTLESTVMTQHSKTKGIKKLFGDVGIDTKGITKAT